jgi:predicted amidohydrolase
VFWEALSAFRGPAGFVHVPPIAVLGEERQRGAARIVAEAVAFEEVPLAAAQFAPRPLDVGANVREMLRLFGEARGARLVLFPELATSGIAIAGPAEAARAAQRRDGPAVREMQARVDASGVAAAFGFVEAAARALYNSAVLLFPGEVPRVYRKRRLFGDDFRWASEGDGGGPWETPLGKIGMAICHDVVYSDIAAESRGCDLVLMPTNWIGEEGPDAHLRAFAAPVLAADRTGEEGGIRFEGRGGLYAEAAERAAGEGVTRVEWRRCVLGGGEFRPPPTCPSSPPPQAPSGPRASRTS